jgi:hypothetical protein
LYGICEGGVAGAATSGEVVVEERGVVVGEAVKVEG